MKFTIDVTQEDINDGKQKSYWKCPIALALKRKTGKDYFVSYMVSLSNDIESKLVPIPPLAADFIRAFDAGRPVHPFTFEIELPA